MQCYPGKKVIGTGDNIPLSSEIELCKAWLDQESSLLEPRAILLFGTPANKTFFRHYLNQRFTKLSDYYLKTNRYGDSQVVSLPHPTSMVPGKTVVYQETFEVLSQTLR